MTITGILDNVLRVATHQNPFTLRQVRYVKDKLMASHPGPVVELIPMMTHGDVILDMPLAKVGGKGLFVKELEAMLLESRADIAIYSMKNVPVEFPQGLGLVTIRECEDPRNAFVFNTYNSLDALPAGSITGTSSLRRQCRLVERRLDLTIRSLRGSVGTRLSKLNNGEYDAIILAVAGLKRLGLESRVRAMLLPETFFPAVGQGAVGIGYRLDDARTRESLAALNHRETALRIIAERAINTRFEGGCQVSIDSRAGLIDGEIWLHALVDAPDGLQIIRGERRGAPQDAEQMGISLAEELPNNGACKILTEVYNGDTPV